MISFSVGVAIKWCNLRRWHISTRKISFLAVKVTCPCGIELPRWSPPRHTDPSFKAMSSVETMIHAPNPHHRPQREPDRSPVRREALICEIEMDHDAVGERRYILFATKHKTHRRMEKDLFSLQPCSKDVPISFKGRTIAREISSKNRIASPLPDVTAQAKKQVRRGRRSLLRSCSWGTVFLRHFYEMSSDCLSCIFKSADRNF